MCHPCSVLFFFFFNDTATTEIYTLSLHDALPISGKAGARSPAVGGVRVGERARRRARRGECAAEPGTRDRKSTRLNSSHGYISYAVFCLKKKKKTTNTTQTSEESPRTHTNITQTI